LSFRTTKRADQGTEKEKLEDGGQKKNWGLRKKRKKHEEGEDM
jgi:hypothetical protein